MKAAQLAELGTMLTHLESVASAAFDEIDRKVRAGESFRNLRSLAVALRAGAVIEAPLWRAERLEVVVRVRPDGHTHTRRRVIGATPTTDQPCAIVLRHPHERSGENIRVSSAAKYAVEVDNSTGSTTVRFPHGWASADVEYDGVSRRALRPRGTSGRRGVGSYTYRPAYQCSEFKLTLDLSAEPQIQWQPPHAWLRAEGNQGEIIALEHAGDAWVVECDGPVATLAMTQPILGLGYCLPWIELDLESK